MARKPRSPKYSSDALKVLEGVWAALSGQCGKYLAASMATQLDALERHGELVDDKDRYSPMVRKELLAMSAASIAATSSRPRRRTRARAWPRPKS